MCRVAQKHPEHPDISLPGLRGLLLPHPVLAWLLMVDGVDLEALVNNISPALFAAAPDFFFSGFIVMPKFIVWLPKLIWIKLKRNLHSSERPCGEGTNTMR